MRWYKLMGLALVSVCLIGLAVAQTFDLNDTKVVERQGWCNNTHYVIVKDGVNIGVLWKNVPLNEVEIDQNVTCGRIPIYHNGEVVGFIHAHKHGFGQHGFGQGCCCRCGCCCGS
jgi:hypothetical protein